jgi:hypothetical protein
MDKKTMIELASNPDTPPKQLGALIGIDSEVDQMLAIHPQALLWILEDLANTGNPETLRAVLSNPNIPHDLLIELGSKHPEVVATSTSLEHFLSEYPDLLSDIPGILETPECPDSLIREAAVNGNYLSKLSVLRNAATSPEVRKLLSPEYLYEDAMTRLRAFANLQEDSAIKKAVEIYADTSLPYCLPRFLRFDRNNPDHRLADQVVGGFPFTSKSWPWPTNESGGSMQCLAQIDLDRAGRLLNWNCGSGLLQVWSPYLDDCEEVLTRVIPVDALSEQMDMTYPDDAPTDSDFEGALFGFHPRDLPLARIEWIPFGQMFYPDLKLRIGELDEKVDGRDPDSIENELAALDDEFVELGIPNSAFQGYFDPWPAVCLGGYCIFAGNGWYNGLHHPDRRVLLNLTSVSGWPLWHLVASVDHVTRGNPAIHAEVACTT